MSTGFGNTAADLASHLASFNRASQDTVPPSSYAGPNIHDIRQNTGVSAMADQVLQEVLARAPFLNPRGNALPSSNVPDGRIPLSMNQAGQALAGQAQSGQAQYLPGCTTSFSTVNCRQFYPHMYAAENTISYADKINQNNINMPNFVYGYSKHLLAILQGRTHNVSPAELTSRVQNLVNIMNVVVTNSKLSDFNDSAWQIGREYANRVNRDIEEGSKSWVGFSPNIAADSYVFAKDHVQVVMANNSTQQKHDKSAKSDLKQNPNSENRSPCCKDYNSKSNEGEQCSWEAQPDNVGKRCNRLHCCNICYKSGSQRTHRALNCPSKVKNPFSNQESG